MNKSLNGFSLTPIQVSTIFENEKPILLQKTKKMTITKNLNSSFTDLNKSLKDISIKKQTSVTRSVKRSMSYNSDMMLGLSTVQK
jgi:hypothetical protein